MDIKRRSICFLGSILLFFATMGGGYAQEDAVPENPEDVDGIKEIVTQLTDLANETHLNADYVPGMVTVFYGRDLENRGIRSAGEALNLVPGVNLSYTSQIYWQTVVRGIPRPFSAGHVKILLNGSPMTTTFGIDLVPNIPVEQVDRIEIVRGAGSTLYGEAAVTAVVNIVTLETGNRVYEGIGSYHTFRGGGIFSLAVPDSRLKLSLNFSDSESLGTDINIGASGVDFSTAGMDFSTAGMDFSTAGISSAGPAGFEGTNFASNEAYQASKNGIFSLEWRDISFRTQWLESQRGGWYQTDQTVVSVNQHFTLTSTLEADAVCSFLKRVFDSTLEDETRDALAENSESRIYEFDYNEQRLQAGLDLAWQIGDGSRMLFDYSYSLSELSDVERELYPYEIYEGDDRRTNSVRLQEEWKPHDRITLIGDLGYDHYSDIGGQVSPKIASVFRLNARRSAIRRHILKMQYGRAFRPPTFLETRVASTTSSPGSEIIDTFEIGYITHKFDETFRVTAFASKLTVGIEMSDEQEIYDIRGFEIEYMKPLFSDLIELDTNLSYSMAENRDTGSEISGSAGWLSNIGLTYAPFQWASLSLQLHSAFDRNGVTLLGEDSPEDTHLLDITTRLQLPEIRDWTLRLGVKNAFKEDIRLYSTQTEGTEGHDFVTPGDDRPERFWWMSLSYDF